MNVWKKILITIISVLVFLVLAYTGFAFYYANSIDRNHFNSSTNKTFTYGTVINGIYCTGMTIEEVAASLNQTYEVSDVEIKTRDKECIITAESVGLSVDFTSEVSKIMQEQKPLLWGRNLFSNSVNEINPSFVVNDSMFDEAFDSLELDECNNTTNDVYIELTENGYELIDNKIYHFDIDSFKECVINNLNNGIITTKADDSFYEETDYTENEKQLISFYEDLANHQAREVVYHFGSEEKKIDAYEWDKLFITSNKLPERFDDYNTAVKAFDFDISEEEAIAYIDEFLDEYNTLNNRYFKGHNGAWVYVTKGNYGNKIDVEKEEKWFVSFVASNEDKASRTPEYISEAKYREKNDFGDTFIEVSLDEQMMWYYVDGEIYVETPVTTGSIAHGGTDPRVVYVYSIIPNKWLVGPTWRNFVKYWVAIQGAIGIHDASWRDVYGGTEYLYNGSHGCVNTPEEAMAKLFNRVEIGTPVIVYSIEKNGVESRD